MHATVYLLSEYEMVETEYHSGQQEMRSHLDELSSIKLKRVQMANIHTSMPCNAAIPNLEMVLWARNFQIFVLHENSTQLMLTSYVH